MDEAKMSSKTKHEERTQRNAKLDEFYRNSGTGCTGDTAPV